MENEYFDEPRRCPKCNIVTYCDTCPTCGQKLPRSRMRRRLQTVGEEEILQPKNRNPHDHIAQRITKNSQSHPHPYAQAEHVEPDLEISSDHSHTYRDHNFNKRDSGKNLNRIFPWISGAIVLVVIAVVSLIAFQDTSTSSTNDPTSEDVSRVGELKEKTSIKDNHGEISIYSYSFSSNAEESVVSIRNDGERSFTTDLVLFDKKGNEVGSYSDLLIMPHEDFDLSMYSSKEAVSYEMKHYEFYEISSTKPDFAYQSYNDYGSAEVHVEKAIDKADLEILIRYLYEASKPSEYDVIYSCYVYLPDDSYYDVFIAEENIATVFYISKKGDTLETYEFSLEQ